MAQMNNSFSEDELCVMADEIMKDLITICNTDPTDSPLIEPETDDILISPFPSLTPSYHKSKSIPKANRHLSLTPTIVSENHCQLLPYDSIDINSIPPIPYSNSNTKIEESETKSNQNQYTSNNKWSNYRSKSETLKPQSAPNTPYIQSPPQIFLSMSANCESISNIINSKQDIVSHISPRPKFKSRKRAQSQIPDYSKTKHKHKNKRKCKKKKRSHTLKRVVSPIFIKFSNNPAKSRSNSMRKAVQQNMNSDIKEQNNEYAIEFEDKLVFVDYD